MTEIPKRITDIIARATRTGEVAGGSCTPADVPTASLTDQLILAGFQDGPWPADMLVVTRQAAVLIRLDPRSSVHYADLEIKGED